MKASCDCLINLINQRKEVKEFLSVSFLSLAIILIPLTSLFILIWCLLLSDNLYLRILATLYLTKFLSDRSAYENGGNVGGIKFLKDLIHFDAVKNYFPVNLVKTVDLTPDRNYLFAVFPHGVLCFGVIFNFVSSTATFPKLFPKIRARVLTINWFFHMPFAREILYIFGAGAAEPKCINAILSASNDPNTPEINDGCTSNAAIIVPGGLREIIFSRPEEYRLIAGSRKGFVKQAIINGSPLVPVFSFGETDLYDQPPNPPESLYRKSQEFTKKWFQIPILKFSGVFGIIPKRRPITTVVGAPIDVTKNENPSQNEINEVHKKFIDALVDLYETHKSKYVSNYENVKLILE